MGSSLSHQQQAIRKMSHTSFKKATFAMGCFWYSDALFGCQSGVLRTRVGYTSGSTKNPTYHDLADHTEAVDIDYDPSVISYEKLLQLFWQNHDSTVSYKRQYRSAVFFRDEEQKAIAHLSRSEANLKIGKQIVTAIEPFSVFYNAEDYHQKYYFQTHHVQLFKSLGIKQENLIESEVAAKLNGYVVGENTTEAFNAICDSLGLSPANAEYVRRMIARGKQAHC